MTVRGCLLLVGRLQCLVILGAVSCLRWPDVPWTTSGLIELTIMLVVIPVYAGMSIGRHPGAPL